MAQKSYDRVLKALIGFSLAAAALWTGPLIAAEKTSGHSEGQIAPDFRLQDQNGKWHELSNYCGQWVALYFYPKNDTPGCTTEACEFRDDIYTFRKNNIKVIGISLDDIESHREFAEKYSLPFTLLSDADKEVARQYDVLKNYGVVKYAARETFLINPEGVIAKHYRKVDPKGHSADVLASIRKLASPAAE
ncbi:MAG: peroxiredoxin [Gammaproteobacteria bacterium]|nr:peroxiredoxin [Gammaproteobacteria bacterium]